jgi:hypothetical protein
VAEQKKKESSIPHDRSVGYVTEKTGIPPDGKKIAAWLNRNQMLASG